MDNTLTPQDITSLNQVFQKNVPTTPGAVSSRADQIRSLGKSSSPKVTSDTSTNLGDNSANAIASAGSDIASSVSGGANDYQAGVNKANQSNNLGGQAMGELKATGGLLKSGLGAASGFINMLTSPVTAAVQTAGDKLGQNSNTLLYHLANSGFGDAIAKGEQGVSDWAKNNPTAVHALNVGLASLLGGNEDIKLPDTSTLKNDLGNFKEGVGNIPSKVSDLTGTIKDKVTGTATKIKEAVKPPLTPEEKVGSIIQGKTTDIPAAQRTMEAIDTNTKAAAKMSPKELSDKIQSKIKSNMTEVDGHYANDNTPHHMSEFEQTTGKGANAVKTNYVQQAIDQLKDFYTKTNDAQGLSDIKALEEKANTSGLNSKDLNDLAKKHGSTISGFNANGEAASGLSKQAAENTRTGVKTTARTTLAQSDPEAAAKVKILDKQTSDAIKTKDLMDKQVEKGNTKIQKNGKPNAVKAFIEKHPYITAGVSGELGRKIITGNF